MDNINDKNNNKMTEITKEQFEAYVDVQMSGVTNMFDVKTVGQLSGLEKELYDTFLIGTFQRSNLNKINEMQQMNLSPKAKETLDMLEKSADNTALS